MNYSAKQMISTVNKNSYEFECSSSSRSENNKARSTFKIQNDVL